MQSDRQKDSLMHPLTDRDGFVFAATGANYRNLARRAARSLRSVMGDVQIDLFADAPVDDAVFDQVHLLTHRGTRPKMEALRNSRFDRTVYLDCDVVAIADCSDIFALLDRFDLVGVQEMYGSAPVTLHPYEGDLPAAFRQINGGEIGVRKSTATGAFLQEWEARMQRDKQRWDQPVLRRMLWETDLRIWVMPHDYNMMHTAFLHKIGKRMSAPRLLHLTRIHERSEVAEHLGRPFDLTEFLPDRVLAELQQALGRDRSLGAAPSLKDRLGEVARMYPRLEKPARRIWRQFGADKGAENLE